MSNKDTPEPDKSDANAQASYYRLTPKQLEAQRLFGSGATHILLYGGARSGKTYFMVRAIILRAAMFPGSRHLMARFRMNSIRASIVADTWPKVMRECFPDLRVTHNKSEGYFEFPNGAQVWYTGVDDKDRTEKVLGMEFATVYFNECSEIPWSSRNIVVTRLAQKVDGLHNRAFYDENPPLRSHWSHRLFIEKCEPETRRPLSNPNNFVSMLLNPTDNLDNIAEGYIAELDQLAKRLRDRFRDGKFGAADESALWTPEMLEQQIWHDGLPELIKVVIAVDPSGARSVDDAARDEIGICVIGLTSAGHVIVLEDLTMKGSPAQWGKAVVNAYRRWRANTVIAEENFGGAMVKSVIMSAALDADEAHLPVHYRPVTASLGKVARAEPVAALFEQGRVWLVGDSRMDRLRDELCNFTTAGYIGDGSPNRADAMVWGISALYGRAIAGAKAMIEARPFALRPTPKVNLGYANFKERRLNTRSRNPNGGR